MSALGQKQTYALQQAMSALPPIATAKADIVGLLDDLVGASQQCRWNVDPERFGRL
jgi:hypothetical protein